MYKKLTDKEIIKAFKICNNLEFGYCSDCSYEYCDRCMRAVAIDTLDLINRLQAQNDELFETLDYRAEKILELEDKLKTTEVENSKLEIKMSEVEYDFSLLKQEREVVKAEAYKEFAERLNSLIMWSPKKHISITAKDINNLLKEKVGDNETVL